MSVRIRLRRRKGAALVVAVAGLTGLGMLISNAASVSAAGNQLCTIAPSSVFNGYWTPFGDGGWTGLGLLTSSQSDPTQPSGVTCGGASVYGDSLPTSDPTQVTALSFDFNADHSGPSGNSLRFVICFSDGDACNSNGNIAPKQWTANTWTHFDALAPSGGETWGSTGGTCGTTSGLTFSAVVACHPGASITQVVVVNDGGTQDPSGEQILLNNLTFNNVVAHEVPPVLGQSAEIAPLSGQVSVKEPGSNGFVPVKTITALRYGAVLHATGGHVQVIAANPGSGFESGEFYDGGFNLSQGMNGVVQAQLNGKLRCGLEKKPLSLAHDASSKSFKLWGHVKGKFKTRGHYGSASVQGTIWLTQERCSGTFFHVVEGVLKIRDFSLHKTVIVRAGHSYLAGSDTIDHDGDYRNDLKERHKHGKT